MQGALDKAFANFFRRVKEKAAHGRATCASRGGTALTASSTPRTVSGIRLTGNRLRVQHAGTIRVKLHRPVEGITDQDAVPQA